MAWVKRHALRLFLGLLWTLACQVAHADSAIVTRVVDGDTLVVEIDGREDRVRLIGVDTPETVHPQSPVEYFGKEASAFTRRMVEGKTVRLETEPGHGDRDKYNRLLRYVYLPDSRLLNAKIIAQGYGHAYTRFPFSKMEEFRRLEREARENGRGLWGSGEAKVAPSAANSETTVYVTRTGAKYHTVLPLQHLLRLRSPVVSSSLEQQNGPFRSDGRKTWGRFCPNSQGRKLARGRHPQ